MTARLWSRSFPWSGPQPGRYREGIERVDIIEELLRLGCHRGQGYLISRPVAPENLRELLTAGKVPASLLRPEELTLGLASTTFDSLIDGASEDGLDPTNCSMSRGYFKPCSTSCRYPSSDWLIYSVLDVLVKRYA